MDDHKQWNGKAVLVRKSRKSPGKYAQNVQRRTYSQNAFITVFIRISSPHTDKEYISDLADNGKSYHIR